MTNSLSIYHLEKQLDQLLDSWPDDHPFDMESILTLYPAFKQHKPLLLEIAYEQYLRTGSRNGINYIRSENPDFDFELSCLITSLNQIATDKFVGFPQPGDCCHGYQFQELIGESNHSKVFLATQQDFHNRLVIVKVSNLANAEISLYADLRHPNLITPIGVFNDSESDLSFLIMPYEGRCTLRTMIDNRFSLNEVVEDNTVKTCVDFRAMKKDEYEVFVIKAIVQISDTLQYLHENGVIHSDIKPSNIIITDYYQPKIIDLNLSTLYSESQIARARGGTAYYSPPELFSSIICNGEINKKVDLFSLGVTLLECLLGRCDTFATSQASRSVAGYARLYQNAQMESLNNSSLDKRLKSILRQSLSRNPDARQSTANEFSRQLNNYLNTHKFFRNRRRFIGVGGSCLVFTAIGAGTVSHYSSPIVLQSDAIHLFHNGLFEAAADKFEILQNISNYSNTASAQLCKIYCWLKANLIERAFHELYGFKELSLNGLPAALLSYAALLSNERIHVIIKMIETSRLKGFSSDELAVNLCYCHERAGDLERAKSTLLENRRIITRFPQAKQTLAVIELRMAINQNRRPDLFLLNQFPTSNSLSDSFHLAKLYAIEMNWSKELLHEYLLHINSLIKYNIHKSLLDEVITIAGDVPITVPSNYSGTEKPLPRFCDPLLTLPDPIDFLWRSGDKH